MPIQEQLHGFLFELLGVRTPHTNLSLRLCLCHWIVLPLPCRIRSWTVQKNPSTSKVLGYRNCTSDMMKPQLNKLLLAIATFAVAMGGLFAVCLKPVAPLEPPPPPETPGAAQVGRSGTASSHGSPAGNICPSLDGIDLLAN